MRSHRLLRLYLVYLLTQPSCQTPVGREVATLGPCLTAPKQEAATLDSLSYYLGRRPAMPLTLCHIAYSHYKPFGSRGLPRLHPERMCVYIDVCVGPWL